MSINTQINTLILFFTFGNYIYIAYYVLKKVKKEILVYAVLPLMMLIFMIILYNSNNGIIHSYFIAIMLLGILFSQLCVNQFKKIIINWKKLLKK